MSQTKLLGSVPQVTAIADTDKIPIVNASGQTVLVPLSGLLAAVKVGARNLVKSTIYSTDVPGARRTKGRILTSTFSQGNIRVSRINLTRKIEDEGYYAISFWVKVTEGTTMLDVDINDNRVIQIFNLGSEWKYVEGVIYAKGVTIGTNGFVDFNISTSYQGQVIISDLTVVRGNVPLQEWIPAPEDWGGVNLSFSALSEGRAAKARLSQKGGPQHEPDKGSHQRTAQGDSLRCARQQRTRRGSRHLLSGWNLGCQQHYSESASGRPCMGGINSYPLFGLLLSGISSGLFSLRSANNMGKNDKHGKPGSAHSPRVAETNRNIRSIIAARREVAA